MDASEAGTCAVVVDRTALGIAIADAPTASSCCWGTSAAKVDVLVVNPTIVRSNPVSGNSHGLSNRRCDKKNPMNLLITVISRF